jgi:HCNGP-like protein
MFADYKSSSEEEDGHNIRDDDFDGNIAGNAVKEGIVCAVEKVPENGGNNEIDILAQFYDEIEQEEYSFKSQSDLQTFESVQEIITSTAVKEEIIQVIEPKAALEIPKVVPTIAKVESDNDNDEIPQTTTQKIAKILRSQGLIKKRTFDYSLPCSTELQTKIEKWTELKNEGLTFNNRLENTHAFKNPSIMSKMISFLELDPYATCLNKVVCELI